MSTVTDFESLSVEYSTPRVHDDGILHSQNIEKACSRQLSPEKSFNLAQCKTSPKGYGDICHCCNISELFVHMACGALTHLPLQISLDDTKIHDI